MGWRYKVFGLQVFQKRACIWWLVPHYNLKFFFQIRQVDFSYSSNRVESAVHVNTFETKRLLTFFVLTREKQKKKKTVSGGGSRSEMVQWMGIDGWNTWQVICTLRVQRLYVLQSQSQTWCVDGRDIFMWADFLLNLVKSILEIAF